MLLHLIPEGSLQLVGRSALPVCVELRGGCSVQQGTLAGACLGERQGAVRVASAVISSLNNTNTFL